MLGQIRGRLRRIPFKHRLVYTKFCLRVGNIKAVLGRDRPAENAAYVACPLSASLMPGASLSGEVGARAPVKQVADGR